MIEAGPQAECAFIGQEGAGGRVLNDQLRLVARIWLNIKRGRGAEVSHEISLTPLVVELDRCECRLSGAALASMG